MRYKPLLILLILFAFICGISSASASDLSNDTDMETYSAEITGINNENQSILTDTGNTVYANNWNELKTYCEKSDKNYIIHLKENTNFYPDNGTDYSQQIIVKNNVTIIGSEGSYFGDTNPNPISIYYTPIVTEDDSKISLKILNTTFKWMDLEKNIPAESGMFIQMGGNSKDNLLENSTFYNINSGTGHGCVYYLKRGYATVKNCSFKNITTEFGVLSIYDPAEDPTKNCTTAGMLVENCYFEDNYAHVEPGCINNCGQLIVKNSTFYKNRAFWWAGAIHTHGGANTTIYNSNFTDNVAGWNGGALYTYSYLQIYNTTFTGNNCTTNNGGGAIGACDYLTKYYITINNSLFENNANICKNTGRGGAISVMDEGGLTIHNTKFINNSAAIGQAICAYYVEGYGDDPNIELINNTFINHTGAADTLTIKLKTGTNTTAILKNNTYLNSTIKLKTFNIVPTSSNIEINKEYEFKVIIELDNAGGYDEDILNKTFYKLYVNEIFEKEFGPESTFKLNITQKETLLTIIPTIGYGNSKNITITSRNTTTLTLGVKEINKTDVTIISTINPGATGNVVFTFQGKEYLTKIENGQATLKLNLMPGNYDIKVRYGGDKNYIPSKNNLTFTVDKLDSNLNITSNDIIEGENATVVITLPEDATGSVNVTAGDKSQIVTVVNGTAKVIFTSLPAGKYNITAIYSGDNKYAPANETVNFTVINNKITNLNISDIVMIYKDGTRMVAVLTDYKGNPIANATVYFSINGVTYVRTTDVNGSASIGLNLGSGVYGASVYYNGSDMYDKVSKNITVTINPTVLADDLVKMYKNDTKFSAKFTDSTGKALVNSDVRFNINGVFYTRTTDANGVASLAINLRPGDYILTAYNPVNGEQKGVNITVKSLIVQNDLTKYYLNASRFQATIYNKDGSLAVNKNVTFNINGVFYIRTTDSNGVVSLAINLRPGDYIITTIFDGLDIGNKVTVLPTLVTKDLNMKYMDGSNFTAQVLDGKGTPLANQTVSFNVNGVFYHRITNEDGIASLRIRLMSGEYIITSYWNNFQTGNTIKIY